MRWFEVALRCLRWLGATTGCSAHTQQPWWGVEGWAVLGVLLVVPVPCGTGGTGTRILTGAGGSFLLAGQRGAEVTELCH